MAEEFDYIDPRHELKCYGRQILVSAYFFSYRIFFNNHFVLGIRATWSSRFPMFNQYLVSIIWYNFLLFQFGWCRWHMTSNFSCGTTNLCVNLWKFLNKIQWSEEIIQISAVRLVEKRLEKFVNSEPKFSSFIILNWKFWDPLSHNKFCYTLKIRLFPLHWNFLYQIYLFWEDFIVSKTSNPLKKSNSHPSEHSCKAWKFL